MASFDECSVLLPSATLEDFPTGGSESDARSLLAGWTVLWHPALLAQTEQIPTWYRADAPPTPDGPRAIVVPNGSLDRVPSDYRMKCEANPDCAWVTGNDRAEMIKQFGLDSQGEQWGELEREGRPIAVDDFFAVGYLSLQIQIMTRRLRYTSNLDELHLQGRLVEAAKAFGARDAEKTAEALHDVFDALAEERDHYFSSDPHLIDLTLLTPSVLQSAAQSGWLDRLEQQATPDDESRGRLGTPRNVLIDGEVAAAIVSADAGQDRESEPLKKVNQRLRELLKLPSIGWAGGGPHSNSAPDAPSSEADGSGVVYDSLTLAESREAFTEGTSLAAKAIGHPPEVYGRLSGMTPVDLISSLAATGYKGVIPIDFAGGTGFGDESKVIIAGNGFELEALTAKPIDAGSDREFLSIGARLGESIDTGEIATGLLVHWPDRVSDSFQDLTRAATWCVALGKFWTLDQYFSEGERPYHHGNLDALSSAAADQLVEQLISTERDVALSGLAKQTRQRVLNETDRVTAAVAKLAVPKLADDQDAKSRGDDANASPSANSNRQLVCAAFGMTEKESGEAGDQTVCFNPHGSGLRCHARLLGGSPPDESYVYAATGSERGLSDVTFDVPAIGFTRLGATAPIRKPGLLKRLTPGRRGIAEPSILRNEFMAVSLDEQTGGISGVYSATRGNRLSMRLVAGKDLAGNSDGGRMVCSEIRPLHSDFAFGEILVTGELRSEADQKLAEFELRYRLRRGSRQLEVSGKITPNTFHPERSQASFWKNVFAIRTAVASESTLFRPIVRDKVHSSVNRKMVAPLGVVIDESEKQTLVTGTGLPLHRKAGDRFLDTLIASAFDKPNVAVEFQLTYAFDPPNPVALARSVIAPPEVIPVGTDAGSPAKTEQAWLVHVSAPEVLISDMATTRREDGKLAARMQLVQTRPKTSKVKLQFCTYAEAAFAADEHGINRPLEELPEDVRCEEGNVQLTLGHHESVDLVVVFDV